MKTLAQVIRVIVWSICILVVFIEWGSTTIGLGQKEISAIQQSALAAAGCFHVLVVYVICRAIDSMTR